MAEDFSNYHSINIAYAIKSYLFNHKMAKGELAEKAGVCPSLVTRWVSGKHNFTVETIQKIEDALKTRLIDSLNQRVA